MKPGWGQTLTSYSDFETRGTDPDVLLLNYGATRLVIHRDPGGAGWGISQTWRVPGNILVLVPVLRIVGVGSGKAAIHHVHRARVANASVVGIGCADAQIKHTVIIEVSDR